MPKRLRNLLTAASARLRIGGVAAARGASAKRNDAADHAPASKFDYRSLELSAAQIEAEAFKSHLGGGAAQWDRRGAFQLALMRHLGLRQDSSLLDIGCGPLRAGVHFLGFLAPGHYRGVDFNVSLVDAAHRTMDRLGFSAQIARVDVLRDFNFGALGETYDYLLCFSVLNHCRAAERAHFFDEVPRVMGTHSRLVITHTAWFDQRGHAPPGFAQTGLFDTAHSLPDSLALPQWGFDDPRSTPLPIRVFRRR